MFLLRAHTRRKTLQSALQVLQVHSREILYREIATLGARNISSCSTHLNKSGLRSVSSLKSKLVFRGIGIMIGILAAAIPCAIRRCSAWRLTAVGRVLVQLPRWCSTLTPLAACGGVVVHPRRWSRLIARHMLMLPIELLALFGCMLVCKYIAFGARVTQVL
jgi:hypothetical protein